MTELANGLTRAEAIAWPPRLDGVVTVEPETENEMPAAKKDDFLTALAKQVATSAVVGALMAGGAIWVQSARGEERMASVQRELTGVKDQLELEKIKTQQNKEKIIGLEERLRTSDEIKRLNDNFDKMFRGRK